MEQSPRKLRSAEAWKRKMKRASEFRKMKWSWGKVPSTLARRFRHCDSTIPSSFFKPKLEWISYFLHQSFRFSTLDREFIDFLLRSGHGCKGVGCTSRLWLYRNPETLQKGRARPEPAQRPILKHSGVQMLASKLSCCTEQKRSTHVKEIKEMFKEQRGEDIALDPLSRPAMHSQSR
jgi:hypothetical protein